MSTERPLRGAAVILAAGESRRMGEAKALLRTADGKSFFEEATEAARDPRLVDRLAVVNRQVRPELERFPDPPRFLLNPRPEEGQLSSLCLALEDLHGVEAHTAGILVLLLDNPGNLAGRVRVLLDAASRRPDEVLAAAWRGEPGHPLWLPRRHWEGVLAWNGVEGLRGYLRARGEFPRPVETGDVGTLRDLDTPSEYREYLRDNLPERKNPEES